MRRKPDPEADVRTRRANAERSWALAELYLQPMLPPYEQQVAFAAKVREAEDTMLSMQAAGLTREAAKRTLLGLSARPLVSTRS